MTKFTITTESLAWYCAGDKDRSAAMGLSEIPALPENDRSLSREPKAVGANRNVISHSPYDMAGSVREILDALAPQGFRINERMLRWAMAQEPSEDRARMLGLMAAHMGEVVYTDVFVCWRGRVHTISGEAGGLQGHKASRACLDAPEAVEIDTKSEEWLYALLVFAHEGWATDLDGAKKFIGGEAGKDFDDIDWMGVRAALAIIEVDESGKTAYLLEQDATCSGFQHMALLGGCRRLAEAVNATITTTRGDLYMEVAVAGNVMDALGVSKKDARKICKRIVMLTGYGAGVKMLTLSYFNSEAGTEFESFDDARESGITITWYGLGEVDIDELKGWVKPLQDSLMKRFPVIRRLQTAAKEFFNECVEAGGGEFRWLLRDGFEAIRMLHAHELGTELEATEHGALPNIIHSLDGMAVRRVIASWDGVLGVVHDAFFTTINESLRLRSCIRSAYGWCHAEYPASFPIQRDTACMPIGMCVGL